MVKYEDLPQWEEFGKILINPRELYFNNKLVVSQKKKRITGFTMKRLSPELAKIFSQILKDEQPEDIQLSPEETLIYNVYLRKANLHKKFPTKNVLDDIKRRVTILEGELGAGNDNKAVKKELKQLIYYLEAYKAISIKDMTDYIKYLNE
jgi:hypothetical protein